jgi:hypothetical protein
VAPDLDVFVPDLARHHLSTSFAARVRDDSPLGRHALVELPVKEREELGPGDAELGLGVEALLHEPLNLDVGARFQLERPAFGRGREPAGKRPFDVEGTSRVSLDQIRVIRIDPTQELRYRPTRDRMEQAPEGACLTDEGQSRIL